MQNTDTKKSQRPGWDEHWINIARVILARSTCLRRKFGAVVVKNNVLLSTGYNGAPRGVPDCDELGKCYRAENNIKAGTHYEKCRSVHAEANSIINAAREGINVKDSVLYLFGEDADGNPVEGRPCKMCRRMIINAGIVRVIVGTGTGIYKYDIEDWIKESIEDPFKELSEEGY